MRNKLKLWISTMLITIIAAGSVAHAQNEAQQVPPLPIDPAVRVGTLPNGLTYFIRHNEQPKGRANFYIAQRVGSMQEEDSQSGLAHFLEHMAFNGTRNYEDKELIHYLESIGVKFGAELNAYTSFDETMYTIKDAPVANGNGVVDSCLLILRDWSDGIALHDHEIDNERGVIENEWRQGDSGNMRAFTKLLAEMFPGLNYGKRMPIGSMDVVRNFTYKELRDYYHKWYRPDLQGLVIVGDIDVDYVENKIKSLYADVPAPVNPAERVYEEIPDREAPLAIVITDPELQGTRVSFSFSSDAMPRELKASAMGITMDYVNKAIEKMFDARMQEITQKPDAPFVFASLSTGPLLGLTLTEDAYDFTAVAHEGRYEEALKTLVAEMKRVRDHGFTAAEYDRIRTEIISEYENSMMSKDNFTNTQYAMEYGHYFTKGGYIPGIEMENAIIQQIAPSITVEAINQQVAHNLSSTNFVIYIMGIEKEGLVYPTSEELLAKYNNALEQEVEPYVDEFAGLELMKEEEQPKAGEILSIEIDMPFGVTRLALSNGAKVYLLPTTYKKNDIRLSAYSHGGYNLSDISVVDKKAMSDGFATVGGVGEYDETALNKVLAGKTVSVNTEVSEFKESIKASSSDKDIETMFQLLHMRLTQNRKDETAFAANVQKTKAMMEAMKSNPLTAILRDSIPHLIYPDDPMRSPLTMEELDQINYDQVYESYNKRFADASDFTFFIVGSFDKTAVIPLVEKYIGSLPSTYSQEADMSQQVSRINQKDTTKDIVFDADTPTAFVLNVFANDGTYNLKQSLTMSILSDVLNQQYFKSIREEEGGTYGVSTQGVVSHAPEGQETLIISFRTDPNSTDKLNEKILSELKLVADGSIDITEYFNKTVLNYEKKFAQNVEENYYWATVIENKYFNGYDHYTDYLKVLKSITVKDVQDYLGEFLKGSRYLKMVAKTNKSEDN